MGIHTSKRLAVVVVAGSVALVGGAVALLASPNEGRRRPAADSRDDLLLPALGLDSSAPLQDRVAYRFGESCTVVETCGSMVGIDCNSRGDGPYYYVKAANLEVITTCGGACMVRVCTDCPPPAWTCGRH